MKRTWWLVVLGLALQGLPALEASYGGCPHTGSCCSMPSGEKSGEPKDLESKLSAKAEFIEKRRQELGLSDQQADDIRKIVIEAKKNCITKEAEVSVVKLDIEEALRAYPVEEKALAGLIQQKHQLKKEKALSLAEAYAKVKNSLSQEQYQTLKRLWNEQYSGSGRCPFTPGKPQAAAAPAPDAETKPVS